MALLLAGCATPPRAAQPMEFQVLVYNIHAGMDAGRVDNLERVAEIIRASGADIVMLQEVDSATSRSGRVDQLARLAALTGMHAAFGSTLDFQGGAFGLGVLTRHPIAHRSLRPYPGDPATPRDGSGREPRGAQLVVVDAPGGALHIVNTHLDASADGRWRRDEAGHLARLTDSLRASGARVIVGGDFNSTPESGIHALMLASTLRDTWRECGTGDAFTFPADRPTRRIDYLFITGPTSCAELRVLPTTASDHRPLLVSLVVP